MPLRNRARAAVRINIGSDMEVMGQRRIGTLAFNSNSQVTVGK